MYLSSRVYTIFLTLQKLHFLVLDDDENRRDDELGDAWLDVNEYVQKNQDMSLSLKKGSLNIHKL